MRSHLAILGAGVLLGCSGKAVDPAADEKSDPPAREVTADPGIRKMRNYPDPNTWEIGTDRQRKRASRSFEQLKNRNVPVYWPLLVEDDEEVTLQAAQDVARRVLVLWAVELRAEGMSQQEALGLIDQLDLWSSVSLEEKQFLQNPNPGPDECRRLVWRLESIWVLLWALGYIEELDWPSGMCDVPKVVEILQRHESSAAFIRDARLRSKAELLDAQDLIMRIHWAIRDAALHQGGIVPEDLDWSHDEDWLPVTQCAAVNVVEERHYTLNWLVRFLNPKGWDDVDTPT